MESATLKEDSFPKAEAVPEHELITRFTQDRKAGYEYRRRRQPQWDDTYALYRDIVETNRLAQRQPVNIPLMKQTIKTAQARIHGLTNLYFKELSNDQKKELIINKIWQDTIEDQSLSALDEQDKKNVLMFGRSYKTVYLYNGEVCIDVVPTQYILIDPKTNPRDINSGMFIIRTGLWATLEEILGDPRYDEVEKEKLRSKYKPNQGVAIETGDFDMKREEQERLRLLGVTDFTSFVGSQTIIEKNEYLYKAYDPSYECKYQYRYAVIGDGCAVLLDKPMEEVLGINRFNYTSWTDDVESTDWHSDGIGDLVRMPNKVVNIWYSQLFENRTLRNHGMYFYDGSRQDYQPDSFEPRAFGMYPLPGKPSDVMLPVQIPALADTRDDINFVINFSKEATAVTDMELGTKPEGEMTRFQVEAMLAKSNSRLTMAKPHFDKAWRDTAMLWYEIMAANPGAIKKTTLYKESYRGNIFSERIRPSYFKSKNGVQCVVKNKEDVEQDAARKIQRLKLWQEMNPNSQAIRDIIDDQMMRMIGLDEKEIDMIKTERIQRPPMQTENAPEPGKQMTQQVMGAALGAPAQETTPPPMAA